jgi:Na+/H+ antiporter NhaC
MIKELKYLFYIIVIFFFIFFIARYYFSDENYKNSYISTSLLDKKIKEAEGDLILLKNNTENIIEFVEYKNNKKKKKYSFWKLLYNDE